MKLVYDHNKLFISCFKVHESVAANYLPVKMQEPWPGMTRQHTRFSMSEEGRQQERRTGWENLLGSVAVIMAVLRKSQVPPMALILW